MHYKILVCGLNQADSVILRAIFELSPRYSIEVSKGTVVLCHSMVM